MTLLSYIIWSPNPAIFKIPLPNGGEHPIVWYGLLFALGFIVSQQFMLWFFKAEGRDPKDVDQLTMYMVIAVVVGARLGHCLFYNPSHYLSNPIEIIKIWEGGLASHGGALGIIIALYLYSRKKADQSYIWILDKVGLVVCLVGLFIRFGNFMNSEIVGVPTGSDNGVVFGRNMEEMLLDSNQGIEAVDFSKGGSAVSDDPGHTPVIITLTFEKGREMNEQQAAMFLGSTLKNSITSYSSLSDHFYQDPIKPLDYKLYKKKNIQYAEINTLGVPRHPAQLYESFYCLLIFLGLLHIWYHHRHQFADGFIFSVMMITLWSARFVDEMFKENQEAFEEGMALNMGQLLSIPMVTIGIIMLVVTLKKGAKQS
ncbi:MAG: prolipoprotein diacylglyceryl transferase [Cyclobacteriaceae bacterium]